MANQELFHIAIDMSCICIYYIILKTRYSKCVSHARVVLNEEDRINKYLGLFVKASLKNEQETMVCCWGM